MLVAHYDAAKTGWLFEPKGLAWRARLSKLIGVEIGLFEPFVWSLMGLLTLALLRAVGLQSTVVSVARIAPVLTLAAHVPPRADPHRQGRAGGVRKPRRLTDLSTAWPSGATGI